MGRSMRALLLVLTCARLPGLVDVAAAQTPSPVPAITAPLSLCSILTVDEVSVELGEPVTIVEDTPDTCVFAGVSGSLSGLAASREHADPLATESLIDRVRATFPTAMDVVIEGLPALATTSAPMTTGWVQAQMIVFSDPTTMLFLTVVVPEGMDPAAVLMGLAARALIAPPANVG